MLSLLSLVVVVVAEVVAVVVEVVVVVVVVPVVAVVVSIIILAGRPPGAAPRPSRSRWPSRPRPRGLLLDNS